MDGTRIFLACGLDFFGTRILWMGHGFFSLRLLDFFWNTDWMD
jgi:hypothetical protein